MRLELLQTLAAILDSGSTQGAARLLGMSQSAVSRRLGQLESELGLALFIRHGSRLVPTRECVQLESKIRVLADRGISLAAEAAALARGDAVETPLRVAFPASLSMTIVPTIVRRFLDANPRVQIELHSGSYDTIERMLIDGRAELGFLRLPLQKPGLAVRPLMRVRTVCVMPREHPLAARDEIGVPDLSSVPLILLGRMRAPRREIDEVFWNAGVRPQVRIEAHSVFSACALAAAGLGVTLVNELMVRDFAHLDVAVRPMKEAILHRFAFAVPESVPPTRATEKFIACATDELRRLVPAT